MFRQSGKSLSEPFDAKSRLGRSKVVKALILKNWHLDLFAHACPHELAIWDEAIMLDRATPGYGRTVMHGIPGSCRAFQKRGEHRCGPR